MNRTTMFVFALLLMPAACTVHPEGESSERERAAVAGAAWSKPFGDRIPLPLTQNSTLADYLAHAEQGNGELEAAWNRWQAALEQVPQDGTQPTTAMIGIDHELDGGKAIDRTGISLMSDTMNNLMVPGRLGARALAALERARTAAAEFDQARLQLQREVAKAYYELAYHDEDYLLMLQVRNKLATIEESVAASVAAGTLKPTARLQVQIAIDRLDAERERMHADRPALIAAVRRIIGGGPTLTEVLAVLPDFQPLADNEQEFLFRALEHNPALSIRRREHDAANAEERAREWLRVPELSLRSALMLDGIGGLSGAVSLPFLRGTAIDGAIAQASANARAAEALQRQAGHDAVAAVLGFSAELRGHEAEAKVLNERLIPRLMQLAQITRSEWTAGKGDFQMVAEVEMQVLEAKRLVLRIRREHAVTRARLAEAAGALLTEKH